MGRRHECGGNATRAWPRATLQFLLAILDKARGAKGKDQYRQDQQDPVSFLQDIPDPLDPKQHASHQASPSHHLIHDKEPPLHACVSSIDPNPR